MKKINAYLSDAAQKVIPYQWEEGMVENSLRFDTNTLPNPPPSVGRFIESLKNSCPINEYSDPSYKKLKELIAQYEKVDTNMITVTNSGDEAIDILAKTFLNPSDYFIVTPPTYEMFSVQCSVNKGKSLEIPLKKDTFEIETEKIIKVSKNKKVKLIFLVNPNNPTGSIISQQEIEKIIQQSNAIVVVDEAYREFYGKSAVPLISKYGNIVILRSFSKFAALAGARIGYLISNPSLSEKFDSIRFPMGVSYLSYKLAELVLENDQAWMKKQIALTKKERQRLAENLELLGFQVYPSYTNFLLVKVRSKAKEICQKLKKRGITVRDRSNKKYLSGCVRITVRSVEENNQLIKVLKEIV